MQKNSAAEGIYGRFTVSKIRRLIRRAVIFPADFRRINFRRRIRRSAAAEGLPVSILHGTNSNRCESCRHDCSVYLSISFSFNFALIRYVRDLSQVYSTTLTFSDFGTKHLQTGYL